MLRFQKQHYGDETMWMETQAQQQSYAFHEESWSSDNNCHNKPMKHFPGMHMNNRNGGAYAMDSEYSLPKHHGKLGGSHGMFHEGMRHDHGFGGGRKYPYGGNNSSYHIPNGGVGGKFNSGGHHEYFSEETEYEEEHAGAGVASVDEMRYERHKYQGGDTCYVNPYERNKLGHMNHKPHKLEWTAKGV